MGTAVEDEAGDGVGLDEDDKVGGDLVLKLKRSAFV